MLPTSARLPRSSFWCDFCSLSCSRSLPPSPAAVTAGWLGWVRAGERQCNAIFNILHVACAAAAAAAAARRRLQHPPVYHSSCPSSASSLYHPLTITLSANCMRRARIWRHVSQQGARCLAGGGGGTAQVAPDRAGSGRGVSEQHHIPVFEQHVLLQGVPNSHLWHAGGVGLRL